MAEGSTWQVCAGEGSQAPRSSTGVCNRVPSSGYVNDSHLEVPLLSGLCVPAVSYPSTVWYIESAEWELEDTDLPLAQGKPFSSLGLHLLINKMQEERELVSMSLSRVGPCCLLTVYVNTVITLAARGGHRTVWELGGRKVPRTRERLPGWG